MRQLNTYELSIVSGGTDRTPAQQCAADVKSGGAAGFGIGAVLGGAIGSVVPAVGTAIGAAIGGALGSLFGGADAVKSSPACQTK